MPRPLPSPNIQVPSSATLEIFHFQPSLSHLVKFKTLFKDIFWCLSVFTLVTMDTSSGTTNFHTSLLKLMSILDCTLSSISFFFFSFNSYFPRSHAEQAFSPETLSFHKFGSILDFSFFLFYKSLHVVQ